MQSDALTARRRWSRKVAPLRLRDGAVVHGVGLVELPPNDGPDYLRRRTLYFALAHRVFRGKRVSRPMRLASVRRPRPRGHRAPSARARSPGRLGDDPDLVDQAEALTWARR